MMVSGFIRSSKFFNDFRDNIIYIAGDVMRVQSTYAHGGTYAVLSLGLFSPVTYKFCRKVNVVTFTGNVVWNTSTSGNTYYRYRN